VRSGQENIDDLKKSFGLNGFGNIIIHPCLNAAFSIPVARWWSHGDHRDIVAANTRLWVANDLSGFVAVHFRHLRIHEYKIIGNRLKGFDGLPAIGYCINFTARFLKELNSGLLGGNVVLHEQDTHFGLCLEGGVSAC
jgi:hypothetical protein